MQASLGTTCGSQPKAPPQGACGSRPGGDGTQPCPAPAHVPTPGGPPTLEDARRVSAAPPEEPLPAPTQTHLQKHISATPGFSVGSCSHVWFDSARQLPHPGAEASLILRSPHPPPPAGCSQALGRATSLSRRSEPRKPREPHDHQATAGSSLLRLCSPPGAGLASGRTSSSQRPAPTVLKEKSPHPFMGCFC